MVINGCLVKDAKANLPSVQPHSTGRLSTLEFILIFHCLFLSRWMGWHLSTLRSAALLRFVGPKTLFGSRPFATVLETFKSHLQTFIPWLLIWHESCAHPVCLWVFLNQCSCLVCVLFLFLLCGFISSIDFVLLFYCVLFISFCCTLVTLGFFF